MICSFIQPPDVLARKSQQLDSGLDKGHGVITVTGPSRTKATPLAIDAHYTRINLNPSSLLPRIEITENEASSQEAVEKAYETVSIVCRRLNTGN